MGGPRIAVQIAEGPGPAPTAYNTCSLELMTGHVCLRVASVT